VLSPFVGATIPLSQPRIPLEYLQLSYALAPQFDVTLLRAHFRWLVFDAALLLTQSPSSAAPRHYADRVPPPHTPGFPLKTVFCFEEWLFYSSRALGLPGAIQCLCLPSRGCQTLRGVGQTPQRFFGERPLLPRSCREMKTVGAESLSCSPIFSYLDQRKRARRPDRQVCSSLLLPLFLPLRPPPQQLAMARGGPPGICTRNFRGLHHCQITSKLSR